MSVNINASTTNGLVLTSDTSGELKLQANGADIATVDSSGITMAAGKTLPASALTGSLPAGMGGKILQVVQTNYTGTVQYNVNSWVNITQLATTITPSSTSSKIIVMGMINSSGYDHDFRLYRNGSVISSAIGESSSSRAHCTFATPNAGDGGNDMINSHILYTDSPASTSAQTYQIYVYPTNNGTFFGIQIISRTIRHAILGSCEWH
jgi:hypothetical protein